MAITVPTGCYRQPTESQGKDTEGNKTFQYVLKGPHLTLETLLDTLDKGDEIVPGWLMQAAQLSRNPGDLGTLTITCTEDDSVTDDETQQTSQIALDETWSLRSVRNDMSILAYCGSGQGTPCREWIEAWQKEPDGKLAAHNQFRLADDTVFTIDVASEDSATQNRALSTLDLIEKIRKGIDSVMRFYPMLTKTTTYANPPAKVYENLAHIDTPAVGTTATTKNLKKPGNLDAIIGAHAWLKCQDDCTQTGDGKYQRVESWMGILSADGGWDVNLYGGTGDRWPMPYIHSGS